VGQLTILGSNTDHLLECICNQDKEIRGQRVTLAQAAAALDPLSRYAIKENSRLTGSRKILNPKVPKGQESFGS